MNQKLLIIGHTFPEPTTTAAGTRMRQLITLFQEAAYEITFATSAQPSEHALGLEVLGIQLKAIVLNDPSFDVFIAELNPAVVLFDRYITEEQFGWRVAEQCPSALRILDTEDLHFLRKARQQAHKNGTPIADADLHTDIAKREIASMYRSDISLLISEAEMALLEQAFKFPNMLLHYLPFLVTPTSEAEQKQLPTMEQRHDFMTIGNFQHPPNLDAILYMKSDIWPSIKAQLPEAKFHVYGAYAPEQIYQLHNEKEGFLIHGWVNEVAEVMSHAKVCLAPLRFGAGLKGKLVDAMQYGTPSVTTPVGAEGMHGSLVYPGAVAADSVEFVLASIQLYTDKKEWETSQKNGFDIVSKRFDKDLFSEKFQQQLIQWREQLEPRRCDNFVGQVLQHQSQQATKYMSRWIEAKNSIQKK